jgi:amino-acid N-acetyltransferase
MLRAGKQMLLSTIIKYMENKTIILAAANSHRNVVIALLRAEKLPVEDLPATLCNFFVAANGSTVVAAAGLEVYESWGLLRSLVVNKAYRSQSIATALVQAVEGKAAELRLERIYLLTETAKGYFERKGYLAIPRSLVPAAVKKSSEFSHVCPVSATVMFKQIIS